MRRLKAQLPPLTPLITFEAAARLLSFTRAADELSLTQAAVSRHIRVLEDALGTRLFERAHRAVSLTAEGRAFQHSVSLALNHLVHVTRDLREPRRAESLCIATDQSVAALWLLPRLSTFTGRHRDVSARMVVSDLDTDCLRSEVDVAILHGDGHWGGYDARLLLPEEVYPVCSPGYAEKLGLERGWRGLDDATLLDLESEHWSWLTWRMWSTETGVPLPNDIARVQINSYPLVVQAARDGQGIALGWRYLVDEALAGGELVRPFSESLKTRFGYYVLTRRHQTPSVPAQAFCDWVLGGA